MEEFIFNSATPHLGGNIDGGDSFTYCPNTWNWLIDQYHIRTVLDIGCAQGHAMESFHSKGCSVIGVEGLLDNVTKCQLPTIHLDLEQATLELYGIDLVWCCEVVEHVTEANIHNLLKMMSSGRVLAMTHAVPGQEGHHHVNCQEQDYWIEKLAGYGMTYNQEATTVARSKDPNNNHFMWHGLIFEGVA